MELTGEQVIGLPRDKVWAGLMNVDTLRISIPGCESVQDEGNGAYSAVVVAAVGPIRARFKGRLQQQDMRPPEQYGLRFEGEGGLAGFAKGDAVVTLDPVGENGEQTRLSYRANAQIGGRLAQIGSRLIDAAAKRISAQFFGKFEEVLTGGGTERAEAPRAAAATLVSSAASILAEPSAAARFLPAPAAPGQGQFSIQMPAWAWVATIAIFAALAGWLASH